MAGPAAPLRYTQMVDSEENYQTWVDVSRRSFPSLSSSLLRSCEEITW